MIGRRNSRTTVRGISILAFVSVQEVLYTGWTQRTESELTDEEQEERKGTVCLEVHLSKV